MSHASDKPLPIFTSTMRPLNLKSAAFVLVALVASGGLGLWLHRERAAAMAYHADTGPAQVVYVTRDMVPQVAQSLRSLKLVTVEFKSKVTSSAGDSSLFGGTTATVTAPVIIRYGVDLSQLESHTLLFSPIHRSYVVTVPPPTRIATEVLGQFEEAKVSTGWLRSRSSSGEHFLGLARRDLHLRAQELSPEESAIRQIRTDSVEQVKALVRSIVGPDAGVIVRFTGGGGEP